MSRSLPRKLPSRINRRIGQAMHDYEMLEDRDRVMIAVSGGVDSLVLTWLLNHWQLKTPISYKLLAVHLDMGFGRHEAELVEAQLKHLGCNFLIEKTDFGSRALAAEGGRSACFHCARQRRNRLFTLARERGFNKIAMGHHREDIIETFFINLMYGGNISTMVPRQELFGGEVQILRPMAYLDKEEIIELGKELGIRPVSNPCPLSNTSKRMEIREMLAGIYQRDRDIKANMFAALSNIREDYLLLKR